MFVINDYHRLVTNPATRPDPIQQTYRDHTAIVDEVACSDSQKSLDRQNLSACSAGVGKTIVVVVLRVIIERIERAIDFGLSRRNL